MRTVVAYTHEIDDVGFAITEILQQLEQDKNLCRNAELEMVRRCVDGRFPYGNANSGGEICAIYAQNSERLNRSCNFSLVSCLF